MILRDSLRSLMLPLSLIDDSLPKQGVILELGCGEGVIAQFLARSTKRHLTGMDINKKRLPKTKNKNLKFICADLTNKSLKLPVADGVVISDVLHHINTNEQKILISKIATSLKKDGVFVIKEIDKEEKIRSALSRFWDFILYPKDQIYYWNAKDLKKYLESLKFTIEIKRTNRFFPGSTTLFFCKINK